MNYNLPWRHSLRMTAILLILVAGVAACTRPAAQPATAAPAAKASPSATPAVPTKVLAIKPEKATVGAKVEASADGLPPGAKVAVVWETVKGGWQIKDYYHFEGKKFSETTRTLGEATVGPDGRLDYSFQIPEDYGGVHNVVVKSNDTPLAQGGVDVTQSFAISPTEGPIGTMIELHVTGLGWQTMESTWAVNWDNQEAGWVSAVSSHGTATARFRATGPVGDHEIKVYTGYMGQSYLNYEQAPDNYLPRPDFVFHTTPGGTMPQAYVEPYQPQPLPAVSDAGGARLAISPTQGPVGTKASLQGSGLPAGKTLDLIWQTWVGNRVSNQGFQPKETEIGKVTVGPDGKLTDPVTIPDDLGGLHAMVLRDGSNEIARAYYVIETSIVSITPTAGPVGTPVTIHLKGVGWTEYDNILVADYDNAYMGYVCGFNSQGDVSFHFTASGAPGIHLIDLYPGIYKGPADMPQQLYRLPQLTYADDHPGNKIPALRLAFQITP